MRRIKTKEEREEQFERIAWRIAAKEGVAIDEAARMLTERLVAYDIGRTMANQGPVEHPYAYEGRELRCAVCGAETRLDGTDSLGMITGTVAVPREMTVELQWSKRREVCRACIAKLPEPWRRLFEPPDLGPMP